MLPHYLSPSLSFSPSLLPSLSPSLPPSLPPSFSSSLPPSFPSSITVYVYAGVDLSKTVCSQPPLLPLRERQSPSVLSTASLGVTSPQSDSTRALLRQPRYSAKSLLHVHVCTLDNTNMRMSLNCPLQCKSKNSKVVYSIYTCSTCIGCLNRTAINIIT